jgi:hypothetical protein
MTISFPDNRVQVRDLPDVYDETGADEVGFKLSKEDGVVVFIFELDGETAIKAIKYIDGKRIEMVTNLKMSDPDKELN